MTNTFLTLVTRVKDEVGIPGDNPTSISGNNKEIQRLVQWVKDSYRNIQNRTSWRWNRSEFTVNTVSGTDTYASGSCTDVFSSSVIIRFNNWIFKDYQNPPKMYLTSEGVNSERWLWYIPWDQFRIIYKIGSVQNSPPVHISITPRNELILGPKPNDIYTINGEYQKSPQELALASDIPEMPSQYHDLIIYYAMEKYAMYESSQEFLHFARREQRRILRQLELNQKSNFRLAGPLA